MLIAADDFTELPLTLDHSEALGDAAAASHRSVRSRAGGAGSRRGRDAGEPRPRARTIRRADDLDVRRRRTPPFPVIRSVADELPELRRGDGRFTRRVTTSSASTAGRSTSPSRRATTASKCWKPTPRRAARSATRRWRRPSSTTGSMRATVTHCRGVLLSRANFATLVEQRRLWAASPPGDSSAARSARADARVDVPALRRRHGHASLLRAGQRGHRHLRELSCGVAGLRRAAPDCRRTRTRSRQESPAQKRASPATSLDVLGSWRRGSAGVKKKRTSD